MIVLTAGAFKALGKSVCLVAVGLISGIAIERFSSPEKPVVEDSAGGTPSQATGQKRVPGSDSAVDRQAGGQREHLLELQSVLGHPDPIEATQRFASLLQTITAEELPEAAKLLWAQPGNSREMNERKRLLTYRWGQLAGSRAVEFAQSQSGQGKVTALSASLAGWASFDPVSAKVWIDGQADPRIRQLYDMALVDGWSRQDVSGATEHVLGLGDSPGNKRLMEIVAGEHVRRNPAEAGSWALELPEGPLRATAIDEVATRWVWADPASALDWVATLPEGEALSDTMNLAMGSWARTNLTAAGTYLNEMSESMGKDHAIGAYSAAAAVDDPATGAEWAATISDQTLREATLVSVARIWLEQDPEAARDWLPQSGLSEEAREQLQP